MKRTLPILLVSMLVVSNLFASPVDQATARKVAAGFAQASFSTMTRTDDALLVKATDTYFVFNIGTTGFVIVSSDDSFRPIVGYSDEGTFPTENPSPEMLYYLDNLSQGRQAALRSSLRADQQVASEWNALLDDEKMPSRNANRASFYLVKTKWNQDYPYNKFCPGNSYAGCVATAMSQVMNFWQYPTHGYGQHSFNDFSHGELSANFAEAEYRFDLMPNSIDNMSPVENIDAVALLMYHCGISVDMMYSTDGSGAYSADVPDAVLKYFGYSNCCRLHYRDDNSLENFQAMLKDQLDMGWPCYYSGQDSGGSGGHAFVCDGYDENDMFHFNWGWSGSGDGFYAIDELNVSSYAFNSQQGVICNFVPSEVFLHTAKAPSALAATPNGDMDFSVTLTWTNSSATLDGHALDTIDQVILMRNGAVIHTFENPGIGEAMSFVDVVGQPITVNYSIGVVSHGYHGRKAHVKGVSLGPTCPWTVTLSSEESGWSDGGLTIMNSESVVVAEIMANTDEAGTLVEIPQGRITLMWTAPADTLEIGMEIVDSEGQTVFSYQGVSSDMPTCIFFETVNTCGGRRTKEKPSMLSAEIVNDDVVLNWTGIADPGYGYNIYRDGSLYGMVSDTTAFVDVEARQGYHSYFVTAFKFEGETEPSNTVCAIDDDDRAPLNLDYEIMPNNKIKLTWQRPANTEGFSGYVVYRKSDGEDYQRVKLCSASATHLVLGDNALDGYHYCYKLVGAFQQGAVLSSPARSLRNPDLLYVEVNRTHIPSNLTLEEQDGQLLLQWDLALLAESYNVYCNDELVAEGLTDLQFTDTIRVEAQAYHVTGVLHGVESSPSNKAYYGSYSVDETGQTPTTVFPNPTQGVVTVQAENLREIEVFNLVGQCVVRQKTGGHEVNVDLTGQDSGTYFFRIRTDQGIQVQKVFVL